MLKKSLLDFVYPGSLSKARSSISSKYIASFKSIDVKFPAASESVPLPITFTLTPSILVGE